jgi:hypothetical protein
MLVICICLACIVVILNVFVVLRVYCCSYFRCRLEVSIRKVLRRATSTQGFLVLLVSTSEC